MWPFKGKPKPQPGSGFIARTSARPFAEKDEWFLHVDSLDYFGEYADSPDGQFTLSWSDTTPDGSIGGNRKSGEASGAE